MRSSSGRPSIWASTTVTSGTSFEEPGCSRAAPSAFFSVSLAAHGDTAEAESYVEEFEQDTGWRPATVALFGGALLYTEYGFLKRHVMKKIARDKPGNLGTDTSRDRVHGWDGVREVAEDFLAERPAVVGSAEADVRSAATRRRVSP